MASYAFKKKSNQLIFKFFFFLNHDKTHCMKASSKLLGDHWSHKCYSGSGSRQGGSASSGAAQKPELGQDVLCI